MRKIRERLFGEEAAVEGDKKALIPPEELIARAKADPESRAQFAAFMERVKAGELRDNPGISGQELQDFLREVRRTLGTR